MYVANSCPTRPISLVDSNWKALEIEQLEDPNNVEWKIHHREANVHIDDYRDEVTIKLARDAKAEQVYSAAYWRSADFKDGGIYEVSYRL